MKDDEMGGSCSTLRNCHSASQEIPRIYGTRRIITMYIKACHFILLEYLSLGGYDEQGMWLEWGDKVCMQNFGG